MNQPNPAPSLLAVALSKKTLRKDKFLAEMNPVIPWVEPCTLIEPRYAKKTNRGPSRYPLALMLKIHCLQQWLALSDPAAEEEIYDRKSFRVFLDIDEFSDRIPDETTILNFRHLLEENDLQKKILACVNAHLERLGLLMRQGTIVDATIIAAPSSTKNKENKSDPEMSSTKKAGQWHFGMKAHIGVDMRSGIVHSVEASTAKVHDSQEMDNLLHGKEEAISGDKGYFNKGRKRAARRRGLWWGVMDRAKRGKKLSGKQKRRNRKIASGRAKVEHPLQVMKCPRGYRKTRYRGIEKNACQLRMMFALCNLQRCRKALLELQAA